MALDTEICPVCGARVPVYRNPAPTADVIIYDPTRGIVLVERRNPPLGYALPGGFMDVGESIEHTAVREAREETGLDVELMSLLGVYSAPGRDPRRHTITTVFLARASNSSALNAGDDAAGAAWFPLDALPELVFDHGLIVRHFCDVLNEKRRAADVSYPCARQPA